MHYTLNLLLWNSVMILFCKGTLLYVHTCIHTSDIIFAAQSTVCGTTWNRIYQEGCCVQVHRRHASFWRNYFCHSSRIFILRLLLTVGLWAHFHSYEVAYSSDIVVSRQHEFVYHIVKLHSEHAGFIRLKYHLICSD